MSGTVELRLAARAENVALARLALAGVAAAAAASPDETADLKLAVSEVCTNAVLHAYDEGEPGDVVLRYTVGDGVLTVEVVDTGSGFDPTPLEPDPARAVPGGSLGLAIARAVTDDLRIESGAGGSRIVFSKRLGGGALS